jgi:purine-binding chemotaxis protein CheW
MSLGMISAPAGQATSKSPAKRAFVVFHLDERRHAVDLATVERVARLVDITPLPHAPGIIAGVIDVEGQVIPVVDIRERLGLPKHEASLGDRLIIARTAHRRIAFVADAVSGVITTSSEHIDAQMILSSTQRMEGVLKLADGLVLIHDLTRFLSLDEETQLDASLKRSR